MRTGTDLVAVDGVAGLFAVLAADGVGEHEGDERDDEGGLREVLQVAPGERVTRVGVQALRSMVT